MWCLCLLWLKYKFSRPRWLNYWNSGKSRYMPYPVSVFASQHKNSSDGLFSIVRQNSACSDLSSQVILKVAWNKKSVGSGGGGRERVDSGKADLATHFPSVCENVKPKMHSIGKNGNHRGAMQARLPAFPHTYPTAKTHLPLGEVETWNQVRKDTELGQNDFRRGSEWPGFQQTTGRGHGEPLKRHPRESPKIDVLITGLWQLSEMGPRNSGPGESFSVLMPHQERPCGTI